MSVCEGLLVSVPILTQGRAIDTTRVGSVLSLALHHASCAVGALFRMHRVFEGLRRGIVGGEIIGQSHMHDMYEGAASPDGNTCICKERISERSRRVLSAAVVERNRVRNG